MPETLSRLRQTAIWPWLRRVRHRVGPPACAGVHTIVTALGPTRLPADLVLKHTYDYRVVYLDPRLIERSLRVGEWARPHPAARGRLGRFRRWLEIGGGWKHLRRNVSRNFHGRFVADGDWDRQHLPFEIRQTVIDLFVDGLAPEQTLEYRKMRDWVERGEYGWTRGCRTLEDVDEYFVQMVHLHDAMLRDGYRTQRELGNDGADEIRVCIDRDGRPCVFGGGTHRLSLALLLGVPEVPVLVKRVHAAWVEDRCEAYRTSDPHEAVARGLEALRAASDGDVGHARRLATT
jgi:hypothetical protein